LPTTDPTPSVLLAASDDWEGVARYVALYAEAGYHVTLMSPPGSFAFKSRRVDQPIAIDSDHRVFLPALQEHLAEHAESYTQVVFANDRLVWAIAQQRPDWTRPWFPLDLDRHPDLAISKAPFYQIAPAYGITGPATVRVNNTTQAAHVIDRVRFPIMVKPTHGSGGRGAVRVETPDELRVAIRDGLADGELAAQEFIEGDVGCAQVLYDNGRLVAWAASYKSKTFRGPFGPFAARRFFESVQVREQAERFGRMTGYHGLCSLDFIEEAGTGRVVMIEVNVRPAPGYLMGRSVGVDFAAALRDMAAGRKTVHAPRPTSGVGPLLRMFPQDIYRFAETLNPLPLLAWPWLPSCWVDMPWREPALIAEGYRRAFRRARVVFGAKRRAWWGGDRPAVPQVGTPAKRKAA